MTTYTFETGRLRPAAVRDEVEEFASRFDDADFVSERLGNVSWSPSGGRYRSDWIDRAPPSEVAVPQVAKTATEDHGHSGVARLYRRFDDEYVLVDTFRTLDFSYWAAADYLAANYGTVPHLPHGAYRLFDPDRQLPGSHRIPTADPESERQAALSAVIRGERDALSLDEAADLLELDEYHHLLATALPDAVEDTRVDQTVLTWLDSDDRAERARAVRWIDAVASRPDRRRTERAPAGRSKTRCAPASVPSASGVDAFERFVATLPSVDETTQRLVARTLWEPWVLSSDDAPAHSHVTALAGLRNAEMPVVRIGALHGASRILGELVVRAETDGDGPNDLERLAPAIESFYEAYVAALSDDHPAVRARAAGLMVSVLGGEPGDDVLAVTDRLLGRVPFETRWDVVRGLAQCNDDREAIATRITDPNVEQLFENVLDSDPAAGVEALVTYGYDARGPEWTSAREALAARAERAPDELVDRIDAPLSAVSDGTATTADLALLTALIPAVPERVAAVATDLVALLDGPNDVRAEAAWALTTLLAERPEAVPVDRATLVDVLAEVRDDRGSLVEERVRRLATVAPDRAAGALAAAAGTIGRSADETRPNRFANAVAAAAQVDPSVVADAASDVCEALSDLRRYHQRAFVGVARAAAARPGAFADSVDALVDAFETDDDLTREALATALVAVCEHDPTALPSPVRRFRARADEVYEPEELARLEESEGVTFDGDGGLGAAIAESLASE